MTDSFSSLVSPHIKELENFVFHVIEYAVAMGDLTEGEAAPEDVVSAALVRASREFGEAQSEREIRGWLIQLAGEQIQSEIRHSRIVRERTIQPVEDLKLEDILPGEDIPAPEEETERKELREYVRAALAGMPREWARVLRLRYVDGSAGAELARAVGKPQREIGRILEYGREYLRQRLRDWSHRDLSERPRMSAGGLGGQ